MQGEENRLNFGTELKCLDLRLIGDGTGYAVPSFVFERKEDSVRIYIPLCRYPTPFGVEGYTLGSDRAFMEELIFTPSEEVYAQRAEEAGKREEARLQQEKEQKEKVEELRQASETDLQPGTIEYERHRLTRAQADAQELKNARDSAEVVETAFCTFVLSRIAGEIASILDGIPLSVQRRFPELENRHVDFLKRDIIKAMNKAAALDELIPGLLSEYIEQSG